MPGVLVVEDSQFFSNLLKKNIEEKLGHAVTCASSYADAMRIVENGQNNFFIALLDLNLPDASGSEIVDYAVSKGLPSLVFTAQFSEDLRKSLFSKKIIDYVVKETPSSLDYVISVIRRIHANIGLKALIVDDSNTVRSAVSGLMRTQQLTALEAQNGVEALAVLKANPDVRVVVTDYDMPEMDGVDLIKKIRAHHPMDELAIIGMSAHGDDVLSAKFIKSGANDIIHKPFQPEEFLCRVTQNLDTLENIMALRASNTELEKQVQARTVELVAAKDIAEKASQVKTKFLAIMSHELRTPLNAIIGFSDSLIHEFFGSVGSDKNKEYLNTIRSSGHHLLKLVMDILEMTNLEAGDYKLKREPCDLSQIVTQSVETVRERAEKSAISLNTRMAADLPLVNIDRDAVEQCLVNILSNAVNFSSHSGRVNLAVRASDDALRIQVVDGGIGIAEQDIARVLDPFVQVEREKEIGHEGIGLGLPICESLMELHGGTIEIDSKVGIGTTVTLSFPPQCIVHSS